MTDTRPWVEKHRPLELHGILSEDGIAERLQQLLNSPTIPHLLFYGPPGTGKTSAAKACAREIGRAHV